jgi:PelA/Pel-15E family pectate lyase
MNALVMLWATAIGFHTTAATLDLRAAAAGALRRGVEFFQSEVAVEGTYLWRYSEDLTRREGEGIATAAQGWVQPPGTPAVGLAVLAAWEATTNAWFLDVARETAYGLIRGQLRSGGWAHSIDLNPEQRRRIAYRWDGGALGRNVTTLDDDSTQCAVRFLMRADRALGFRDRRIHEAVEYALNALLAAQYPNGAWPQGFDQPPDAALFPVKRAKFPEQWSRTWPGPQEYRKFYTFNDNSLATLVNTLLLAAEIYGTGMQDDEQLGRRCRAAAERAGEFILLAQLPEPQPGWAQQYDFEMQPAWARRFEPPAVTGGEARSALRTLLVLFGATGREAFLEPVPRALGYYRRSRLPDGRLARFYELESNRPLYFTREYVLTHDDRDVPTHYSFKVADWTDAIEREYEGLRVSTATGPRARRAAQNRSMAPSVLAEEVRAIIDAQDADGRWVQGGGLRYHQPGDPSGRVISTATFNDNIETLSRYLIATAP